MSIFNRLYKSNSELSKNEYKANMILGFSIITLSFFIGLFIGLLI